MRAAFLILFLLCAAGGAYFFYFSPQAQAKRHTQAALDAFSAAVESQDRAKVSAILTQELTNAAQIELRVHQFSLLQPDGGQVLNERFDKAGFITFLDTTLYSITDYHAAPMIDSFALTRDTSSASVTFSFKAYADGKNYYAGKAVGMRFSSDISCTGEVQLATPTPQLGNVSCDLQLRTVPKPEEAATLGTNPEALREYLR